MKSRFWIMCLALLCLCACNGQPSVPAPEPLPLEDNSNPRIAVIYGSEAERGAMIVHHQLIDNEGKLPRCVLHIKNLTTVVLPIEYKFTWFDKYGAPLQSSASWQRTRLPQNGDLGLSGIGKSVNAATVQFMLRFPTDVQIWVPEPDPVEVMKEQQRLLQEQM